MAELELIASENFTSEAVLEATGSVFTNKYAEGYPGKRYYGGCEFADVVENLARERAKKLFGAEHANVQPHSGSQANQAAYCAVLQPGDTIMGMNLAHGGHLTHGHPLNFSGKTYHVVPYGVRREDRADRLRRTGAAGRRAQAQDDHRRRQRLPAHHRFRALPAKSRIRWARCSWWTWRISPGWSRPACIPTPANTPTSSLPPRTRPCAARAAGMILRSAEYAAAIDKVVFPGAQGGPLVHVIAAKAVCFLEAMTPEFVAYQKQVIANAQALAASLEQEGFRIVSGGTDTHLLLVDVFAKGVRGKEAEKALDEAYITVNKNAIPFDQNPPLNPSGVRLGSPAVTTRGFKEAEMREVGGLIAEVLNHISSPETLASVRRRVTHLAERFPLYGWKLARTTA